MIKIRELLCFAACLLVVSSLSGQDDIQKKAELSGERPQKAFPGGDQTPDEVGDRGLMKNPQRQFGLKDRTDPEGRVAPMSKMGPMSRSGPIERATKRADFNPNRGERTSVHLEELIEKLHSMEVQGGGDPLEDDWFVVGGSVGSDVNFDAFQGERNVAERVVDFLESTNDRGQWRVFYRVQDSEKAEELVSKVKNDYGKWRRQQQRTAAAAQRRVQAAQRSRSGGFRSSGIGRSGSC